MSSLANGCCINENSDDFSETEEFFVKHAYSKSSYDRNNRKAHNDNSGKIYSKDVSDEDFCIVSIHLDEIYERLSYLCLFDLIIFLVWNNFNRIRVVN